MKLKKKFIFQSIFSFLITAFFFFGFGLLIYEKYMVQDLIVQFETKEKITTRKIKNYANIVDSLKGELKIKPKRFDIIRIDTQYYEIPIIPYIFLDSISLFVDNKEEFIPFKLMIDGYVSEYSIWEQKKKFNITIDKKKSLFGSWQFKTGIIILGLTVFYIAVLK